MSKMTSPVSPLTNRRTQATRRDRSEQGLLAAAADLIVERGLASATFENIGVRAGYSRGLATQKFGSKQGMIEHLILRLQTRLQHLLDDRHIEAASGLEATLAFIDIYLRSLAEDRKMRAYFILLAGAVAVASGQRALFAAAHADVERRIEAMLQRGQIEGNVRGGINPDAAALMIGSMLFGLSMQILLDPDLDLDPIRETSLSTLRLSFQA
jgi:AcrR family transcriptional regulator